MKKTEKQKTTKKIQNFEKETIKKPNIIKGGERAHKDEMDILA